MEASLNDDPITDLEFTEALLDKSVIQLASDPNIKNLSEDDKDDLCTLYKESFSMG